MSLTRWVFPGVPVLDHSTQHLLHIKVGSTTDPSIRLNAWRKQCTSREGVILGCWPLPKKPSSKLYAEIRGGLEKAPFVRRAEHLIHLELADVACHHPVVGSCALVGADPTHASACLIIDLYSLRKGGLWLGMLKGPFPVSFVLVSLLISSCYLALRSFCGEGGTKHREIFTFQRATDGELKGREYELVIRPIIEKWVKFVQEHMA